MLLRSATIPANPLRILRQVLRMRGASNVKVDSITYTRSTSSYCGANSTVVTKELLLMPLGGSVTHGAGSEDGNGYRDVLLKKLIGDGWQTRMVGSRTSGSMTNNENEGWRGFRLDQISEKAKKSVEFLPPNILAVNAGSNDCIQNYRLDSFQDRMCDLLHLLWLASPESTILLSTLLVNSDEKINSRILYVNDQIRSLARTKVKEHRRIILVDMQSLRGPQISDLVEDGTHPDSTGYSKMADLWYDGIREAVCKGMMMRR